MINNYLTKEQIDSYKRDGVIIVRDVFKPWINSLQIGFEKVLENPGPHARDNVVVDDAVPGITHRRSVSFVGFFIVDSLRSSGVCQPGARFPV